MTGLQHDDDVLRRGARLQGVAERAVNLGGLLPARLCVGLGNRQRQAKGSQSSEKESSTVNHAEQQSKWVAMVELQTAKGANRNQSQELIDQ